MRHTNFIEKNTSFKIIGVSDLDVAVWTFTLTDGLVAQTSVTPTAIGDYFSSTISVPDADCFVLTKQDGIVGICRVGDPEVLLIGYTGTTGETNSYIQFDTDGVELDRGDMVEIGEGFYHIEPADLSVSYFDVTGLIKTLNVPYKVVNVSSTGGGITSDGIFNNVGFNMFGFLGDRNSYFDLSQGTWINDDTVEAKASDLAKAVCHKYNLVWDDDTDANWIGNYIKYLRSYTENDGYIRYYKPYKTPDSNDANFSLMQTDEDGNLVIKGISMLLLQTLETVNNVDGVIIPFRTV